MIFNQLARPVEITSGHTSLMNIQLSEIMLCIYIELWTLQCGQGSVSGFWLPEGCIIYKSYQFPDAWGRYIYITTVAMTCPIMTHIINDNHINRRSEWTNLLKSWHHQWPLLVYMARWRSLSHKLNRHVVTQLLLSIYKNFFGGHSAFNLRHQSYFRHLKLVNAQYLF